MRVVDTNIVVRLIARDDPRQVELAEAFIKGGAWVSTLVLQETLWVLERAYKVGRVPIARLVELLLDHESLVLEAPALVRVALSEFRGSKNVGFSDCLVLASARAQGHLPVGTFDKRLAKLADTEVLR